MYETSLGLSDSRSLRGGAQVYSSSSSREKPEFQCLIYLVLPGTTTSLSYFSTGFRFTHKNENFPLGLGKIGAKSRYRWAWRYNLWGKQDDTAGCTDAFSGQFAEQGANGFRLISHQVSAHIVERLRHIYYVYIYIWGNQAKNSSTLSWRQIVKLEGVVPYSSVVSPKSYYLLQKYTIINSICFLLLTLLSHCLRRTWCTVLIIALLHQW